MESEREAIEKVDRALHRIFMHYAAIENPLTPLRMQERAFLTLLRAAGCTTSEPASTKGDQTAAAKADRVKARGRRRPSLLNVASGVHAALQLRHGREWREVGWLLRRRRVAIPTLTDAYYPP